MRLRNTLILLVIAAVFLIYFFAVEQPRHREELNEIERSTKITGLERGNIYHITIQRGGETLAFAREGETWSLTAPIADRANQAAVNRLIASALDAKIERILQTGDIDAAAYGLGPPPDAILRLQTAAKDTSLTIRLGGHNITKSHFYARVDASEEVLLLPAGLRRYVLQDLSDFRDQYLIEFDLEEVKRLKISSADRTLFWEKDARHQWVATLEGDTVIGNPTKVESILRRLRGIRVRGFLSDQPAHRGKYFPDEVKKLTFWTGSQLEERSVNFSAGNADTCHAQVEGEDRIVSISAVILSAFDQTYDELRDKNIFHFSREEAAMIRLNTSDTTATVIKTGKEWAFANPVLGQIDQNQVEVLLRQLEGLQYQEIIENRISVPFKSTLERPSFQLTIYDLQEDIMDELSSSPNPDDASVFLATSRSTRLLGLVPATSLHELKKAFRALRLQ